MTWAWTIFVTLFFAELPDKTSLVSLSLLARHRPFIVWSGASLALTVQTALALVGGDLLSLIPRLPLMLVESLMFVILGAWLWRESHHSAPITVSPSQLSPTGFGKIFLIVFAAEFLDLTQLATMGFAADHASSLWLVGLSAVLALITANALVVTVGRVVLAHISRQSIQRIAAVLFFAIAAYLMSSLLAW